MLHNPKRAFQNARAFTSPAAEARRLQLEHKRLRRRLDPAAGASDEQSAVTARLDRIARDLAAVRADSVHAVENKLKVALDTVGDRLDEASHKLLASALADLHYIAILSEPRQE